MAAKPKQVIIVGGSLSGLMHGIVCTKLGLEVSILESREPDALVKEAAGLTLGPDALKFMRQYFPDETGYTLETVSCQFLGPDSKVLVDIPSSLELETTSWSVLFHKLKARFEQIGSGNMKASYNMGKEVKDLRYDGNVITVIYRALGSNKDEELQADLVIAADGGRSLIRSKFLPEVHPSYAGYLAWRGCIPESQVPQELKGVEEGKSVMTRVDNGYILTYFTPGQNDSMQPGERLLEWCWYEFCDDQSPEFSNIMTDASKKRHHRTVPKGLLAENVWKTQVKRAELTFPAPWVPIISGAQSPFVTAITGFASEKASFCDGKLLLSGDAFTQFRPHMGLSCNQAALQAQNLVKVLTGEMTISDWEKATVTYGQEFARRSIAFGQFALTGKWPNDYVPLYLQKKASSA